jgi:predicted PolB exonuclease-like 3'-5' exonuclease
MNHGEVLSIWWRNGLKFPELPLDECIFPNAERLLKIEQIIKDLLEACKNATLINAMTRQAENARRLSDDLRTDAYYDQAEKIDIEINKIRDQLQQAIAKAEGGGYMSKRKKEESAAQP